MTIAEGNATVPKNINRIIDAKGLKRGYIAKSAGYSSQQLTDMLNGRKIIKPCDVIAIANALRAPVWELFEERDAETGESA